jgi:hypothetical protein
MSPRKGSSNEEPARSAPDAERPGRGAKTGRSSKKDTSPPLGELPPDPPQRGEKVREMPRPRPTGPAPDQRGG